MADDRLQRARKRVRALREFYVHAAIYVVVISGLAAINWITSPGYWWVVWPMLGWGIAVGAHAVSVFFEGSMLGAEWEDRKTRELMERMGPVELGDPHSHQAASATSRGTREGAIQ